MTVSTNRPALFAALLAWANSGAAWARNEGAVAVTWRGATCPEVEQLEARIGDALEGPRSPSALEVEAEADADGGAWRGAITLRGATGLSRTIHADDCGGLVDATELVAIVALDPFVLVAQVAAVAPTNAPLDLPEPEVPPTSTPPVRAGNAPPPDTVAFGSARVELGIGGIDLPGIGGRVGLALGWQRRRLRIEAPIRWSWPRAHVIDATIFARVQLVSVLPRLCAVFGKRGLQLLTCGGAEIGTMIAAGRGDGLARTRLRAAPWAAAHAGVAVSWLLVPRLSGWLGVDGAVAFARPAFHVREPADAYLAGPASVSVIVGLAVHFGSSFRALRRTQP